MAGRVIFIIGASCTGKSTFTKKICELSNELFYRISLDDFYNMLPLNNVAVIEKDYIYQTNRLMFYVIKYLIKEGRNVIVDTILLHKEEHRKLVEEMNRAFDKENVLLIKLKCNMEELKKRAEQRGDRDFNIVQRQVAMSFPDYCFDFVFDTSENSMDKYVKMLIDKLDTCVTNGKIGKLLEIYNLED